MILPLLKSPLQIQAEESPRFDNTFVFIGPFHTEAAHFHAVGIFVAESAGPSILIACDILASEETVAFLLTVQEAGNAHIEKFIKEVDERPAGFEEPIKRNKLNTKSKIR